MFRIITDTASDLTRGEANKINVKLVQLPVTFEDVMYAQELDRNFTEFYSILKKTAKLPTTSQPPPFAYLELFNEAKKNKEDVLVITLSSGLSGTYESAVSAKAMCGYENVYIVDSMQATISQRMLVDYAINLREVGRSAKEAAEAIECVKNRITVFGLLDTLTYLKKGGRIPPSMAIIGNTLGIKAAIMLKDGKLEPLGKAHGHRNGKKFLWNEIEKNEPDIGWPVYFGCTALKELGEQFMSETTQKYGFFDCKLFSVGALIGTHIGPEAIFIAYVKKN